MTIRAILFDAGNTLLFLDYRRLAEEVGTACGLPLTEAGLAAGADEAAQAMERRDGSDRDRATLFLNKLFRLAGVPADRLAEVRDVLGRMHRVRHLWSGAGGRIDATLRRLRAAGIRLGVVSNGDGRVADALELAGLRQHFDVVVDSGLAGVEKPDPRIFRLALEQLDVVPEEALYIGDLYEVDVVGARAAGLSAALVDPAGRHAGREVPSAPSVVELIERLAASGQIMLGLPQQEMRPA